MKRVLIPVAVWSLVLLGGCSSCRGRDPEMQTKSLEAHAASLLASAGEPGLRYGPCAPMGESTRGLCIVQGTPEALRRLVAAMSLEPTAARVEPQSSCAWSTDYGVRVDGGATLASGGALFAPRQRVTTLDGTAALKQVFIGPTGERACLDYDFGPL